MGKKVSSTKTNKTPIKISSSTTPRNVLSQNEELVKAEYGQRVKWLGYQEGTVYYEQKSQGEFLKGNRTDYGRAIDIRIPKGYHAQVSKSWEMYDTDRIFRYLIDRCGEFGANGFEWEVPLNIEEGLLNRIFDKVKKGKIHSSIRKIEKEKKVWDHWAANINKGVPNVLPGIDEINKWIYKHCLLSAMGVLDWEYDTVEVDKVRYELPVRMTIHNPLSIALDRDNVRFVSEKIFLKISENQKKIVSSSQYVNLSNGSGVDIRFLGLELPQMGANSKNTTEAFALKYNWTPGDNTTLVYNGSTSVGQGLYPTPPFVGLFENLLLRKGLTAADLSIIDGVIDYLLVWKIGNDAKDEKGRLINQPRPAKYTSAGAKIAKSSIEMAQEIITKDTRGSVLQLFLPYFYDLKIITPDVAALVSTDKYIEAILELFIAFGIFISPPRTDLKIKDLNIANFEQMVENIRKNHIRRFWESLCSEIVKRNPGTLTILPNMVFNPLNTQDADFRTGIFNLAKLGLVSKESTQKAYRLDKKTELARIIKEVASGEKDLFDVSVPISYKQSAVHPGGRTDSNLSPADQEGRPPKEEPKEDKTEEEEEED